MQYYVKANGEHVMSYRVFCAMRPERLCNILGIGAEKTSKKKGTKKS